MTDQTTTEPTSVGLTADQVLTLLATWLREQGLKARHMRQSQLDPGGDWWANFVVADDDLDEWSWALEVPFAVTSDEHQWWHTLDDIEPRAWSRACIDGIRIGVHSDMHAGPIPPEFAAGESA